MKKTLLLLPLTFLGTLYAGHQVNNMEIPTNDRYRHYIELQQETMPTEPIPTAPAPAPTQAPTEAPTPASSPTPIDIYEDGSATMSDGTTRPEDTYPWDCRTEGNKVCGTEVNGTWYLLDFDTMTFSPRG